MDASDNWEILAKEGSSGPQFAHLQRVSNSGASTRGCGNKVNEYLLGPTPHTKPQPLFSHCLTTKALDGGSAEGPGHSWFWKGLFSQDQARVTQVTALPAHQPEVVTPAWENRAGSAGTTGQEKVGHGS